MSFLHDFPELHNTQDPPFELVTNELFNKLDGVTKDNLGVFPNMTSKRIFIIDKFIESFKTHIGNDIYPTARLILPNKDYRMYFIKHTNLVRLIIKMYNIPRHSLDHTKLSNWKKSYHSMNRFSNPSNLRNLPLSISHVISNKRDAFYKPEKVVTVLEINQCLDDLTQLTKSSDQINCLKPIMDNLTIDQIRWFLSIILKISPMGYMEKFLFFHWHPDALAVYNICHNLQLTFNFLTDTSKRIPPNELILQPHLPFKPQLSFKVTTSYSKLVEKFNKKFLIEEKMDGDRMLIHYKDFKFKFFSRRCRDYTLLYGENFQIGSLTRYLSLAFKPGVKSIILDGEMIAYDFKRKIILPFGTLKQSAMQESANQFNTTDFFDEQSSWPLFFIFDVLHINGRNLTNHPLKYRKSLIPKLVNPIPNKFEILRFTKGKSVEDIETAMKDIISDRNEGIMVKNLNSKYHHSERNNSWVKIKPEYLEEFGENLDLVVIGVIPAIKNSYMCGLYDKTDGKYKSFCTVANGFTETEFLKIDRLTSGKWNKFNNKVSTSNIVFGTKKPDYWIEAKDSIVLEIKARSVDNSTETTYAAGSTLHNLYCRSIRDDKSFDECISLQEYQELKEIHGKNYQQPQGINEPRRKPNLELSFNNDKVISIEPVSKLFENFQFVVLSDKSNEQTNERISINDLKQIIKNYSGKLVYSPKFDDTQAIIISEKLTPTCQNYFKMGYTIMRPEWIFQCIKRLRIIPLEPSLIFKGGEVESQLASNRVDQYGDSYTIMPNTNMMEYLDSLDIPGDNDDPHLLTYNPNQAPLYQLFKNLKFFIIDLDFVFIKEVVAAKILQFSGAIVTDHDCHFLIIPQALSEKRDQLLQTVNHYSKSISEQYKLGDKLPRIVTESFINESISAGVLVDAQDHSF